MGAALVGWGLALLRLRRYRAVPPAKPPVLGVYPHAFLCGGPCRTAQTALAALHLAGRIAVVDGRIVRTASTGPPLADPVKAAALIACLPGRAGEARRVERRVERSEAVRRVGDDLAGSGLITSPRLLARVDSWSMTVALVAGAAGVLLAVMGAAAHRPDEPHWGDHRSRVSVRPTSRRGEAAAGRAHRCRAPGAAGTAPANGPEGGVAAQGGRRGSSRARRAGRSRPGPAPPGAFDFPAQRRCRPRWPVRVCRQARREAGAPLTSTSRTTGAGNCPIGAARPTYPSRCSITSAGSGTASVLRAMWRAAVPEPFVSGTATRCRVRRSRRDHRGSCAPGDLPGPSALENT
ncbi:TIGR04222 domain-containing membrane protein [Streptomyces sp. NPDC127040]